MFGQFLEACRAAQEARRAVAKAASNAAPALQLTASLPRAALFPNPNDMVAARTADSPLHVLNGTHPQQHCPTCGIAINEHHNIVLVVSLQHANHVSFVLDNQLILARLLAIFTALTAYCHALIYLHNFLAIIPIVVILTLFVLMYTNGLGGNIGMGSGVPLAYLVFNWGMRRIMDHGHSQWGGTGLSVHWWWR